MQTLKSFSIQRLLPILAMFLLPGLALAGTADTEFAGLRTMITNWVQGNLAVSIVLGTAVIGAVVGLARVTAMPMLTSVVFALVFSIIVGFTTGIITATI